MVNLFSDYKKPLVLATTLCAIFFYTNIWQIRGPKPFKSLLATPLIREVSGVITSNVSTRAGSTTFFLLAQSTKSFDGTVANAKGEVFVKLKGVSKAFLIDKGSRVTLKGTFTPAKTFRATVMSDFSFPHTILGVIYRIRAIARQKLRALIALLGPSGALLLALVMGSRDELSEAVTNAFRTSGTSFILALSGMHLVIYGGAALKVSKKAFGRKASLFISLAVVSLFVFFIGFTPSLLRAFIFFVLSTVLYILSVRVTLLVRVFATLFAHCLIAPSDLATVSFQLSYAAIFAIALASPVISKAFARFLGEILGESLSIGVSAFVATFPITIYNFGFAAPVGILASVLITPLIMLFIIGGVLALIFMALFPISAGAANMALGLLYALIINLLSIFSKAPMIFAPPFMLAN